MNANSVVILGLILGSLLGLSACASGSSVSVGAGANGVGVGASVPVTSSPTSSGVARAVQIQDGLNLVMDSCNPGAYGVSLGMGLGMGVGFSRHRGCNYKWVYSLLLTCAGGTVPAAKGVAVRVLGDIKENLHQGTYPLKPDGRLVAEFETRSVVRSSEVRIKIPGIADEVVTNTEVKTLELKTCPQAS